MFNGVLHVFQRWVSMPPSSIFAEEKCQEGIWRDFGERLCREDFDVLPCDTGTWSHACHAMPGILPLLNQVSTLNKKGRTRAKN